MEKVKSVLAKVLAVLKTAKDFVVSKTGNVSVVTKTLVGRVVAFVSTPVGRYVVIGVAVVLLLTVGYCALKSHSKKPTVRIQGVEAEVKINDDASVLDSITKKLGF